MGLVRTARHIGLRPRPHVQLDVTVRVAEFRLGDLTPGWSRHASVTEARDSGVLRQCCPMRLTQPAFSLGVFYIVVAVLFFAFRSQHVALVAKLSSKRYTTRTKEGFTWLDVVFVLLGDRLRRSELRFRRMDSFYRARMRPPIPRPLSWIKFETSG